ncbi:hypothetical protein [uncultured Microbulbifer sp.]|nr:hypothetical protein [uncultured Microbulbifer sp.]
MGTKYLLLGYAAVQRSAARGITTTVRVQRIVEKKRLSGVGRG